MNVLAIETSDRFGALALEIDGARGPERRLATPMAHGRDLASAIHALLADGGLTPQQVDLVAVDTGPGSFTGLRVGAMAAKVFACFAGKPLIGIGSMRLLIENLPADVNRPASPLVVARQGMIYATVFEPAHGQWIRRSVDTVVAPRNLPGVLPPGSIVFGNALERYGGQFAHYEVCVETSAQVDPWTLARLARDRFDQGERDDPLMLNVNYLRPPRTTKRPAL